MLRRFQRRKGYSNETGSLAFDPHAGLVDEHGHWGYVYYPTVLVRDSCRLSVSVEEQSNLCVPLKSNGTEDWEARVFGGHIQVSASSSSLTSQQHNGKVFCIHSYVRSAKQTRTIRWGKRCDGFLTASTETIHQEGTVHLPHYGNNVAKHKGIWQKVRSMLACTYDNFLEEYDFFFISGDDTFLRMENIMAFSTSPNLIQDAREKEYPKPWWLVSPKMAPAFWW